MVDAEREETYVKDSAVGKKFRMKRFNFPNRKIGQTNPNGKIEESSEWED